VSLQEWLEKEGSPLSRVDRVKYSDERRLQDVEYDDFTIRY
jgi:hypothetical protein